MADTTSVVDAAPLQDRDLLLRLSLYFDGLEGRLRQGEGWFIFNAASQRARRISWFIQQRLADYSPSISYCLMPWRDFALSAYVQEVGLPDLVPAAYGADDRVKRELEIARHVAQKTYSAMVDTDVLVVVGLKPAHEYEATYLDRTLEGRYRQRLATILLTPDMPRELEAEFETVDPTKVYWDRLYQRMYETSLVAV